MVVSGYSTYLLASAAFERRQIEGVVALRDLPALIREANAGSMVEDREVDFVLDSARSSVLGDFDLTSRIGREVRMSAATSSESLTFGLTWLDLT